MPKLAWPRSQLGDVLTERREVPNPHDLALGRIRTIAKIRFDSGRFELRSESDTRTNMILVHPGDLVISGINAAKGAIALHDADSHGPVAATIHYSAYEVKREAADARYLWWYLRSNTFREVLLRSLPNGIKTEVKAGVLLAMECSLPSVDEQQRIVARIEAIASKIEQVQRLRAEAATAAAAIWPSILQNTLLGRPSTSTTDGEEDARELLLELAARSEKLIPDRFNNAHPHKPVVLESGPESLPSGWVWTTLGSVLTHLIDCVNDTPDFAERDTGFIGLKSTNVRPNRLDLTQRWYMTEADFNRWNRRAAPRAGDIVLTREAPMGYACAIPDTGRYCLTQRLLLVRPDTKTILPEMLLHYLNSPLFQTQVFEQCRGLTTPHIRVQDMPNFMFPLAPMNVQKHIVDELGSRHLQVSKLRECQTRTAVEIDALLPAVLDRAFKGEL